MNRIEKRFFELREKRQKALVAFITAGDPDLAATKGLFAAIEKGGADIIELGVPFTDPLADGPVILQSALRAIKGGVTLRKILDTVTEIRRTSELPVVLMSSFNPIFVYGEKRFVDDAARAGVDGVIIPDLPPEEGLSLADYAGLKGLAVIYLAAPTSTEKRLRMVAERSRGFIYYISITGVTGVRDSMAAGLAEKVARIKEMTPLPVLIGFGISGPEQAAQAARIADGAIVGSAVVKIIEQNADASRREGLVAGFIADLKRAVTQSS